MIWFLLLSLVPLMFITGFSLVTYEQAIDSELVKRLGTNAIQFTKTMTESEKFFSLRRNRYKTDPLLSSYLLTNAIPQIRQHIQTSARVSPFPLSITVFNSDGEIIASYSKDSGGNVIQNTEVEDRNLGFNDDLLKTLNKAGQRTYIDTGAGGSMDLVAVTRIDGKAGRRVGYIEEVMNLGTPFLENVRNQFKMEVILFDARGKLVVGSHDDFKLYTKEAFSNIVLSGAESVFELTIRDEPFTFLSKKMKWGDSDIVFALGASKQESKAFVRKMNVIFFTTVGAVGILLILTSIVATQIIVRPVYELVAAIRTMDTKEGPSEIPVSTDTELGVLQESFNEMSRRIHQAQSDLENKVHETESAYSELKQTQARLVHTAKMASLGQLVAGIAHELNNPIGFIYSNMTHLKDYSERLMAIIETAEKDPSKIAKAKKENDFDYIVQDLPRLVSSCEEGARRTRDIVLGLRNFSRLDEAKLKRVSLQEGIENTLRLLAGELKNRVKVHTEFENVPEVLCYASQLNQVFMNILSNAAQAIENEGEIWIGLKAVKEKSKPGKAQISIRDSGKGMKAETLDKIFDPFFTTKNVGQGTGLGLSISYGIIKQHGGDIQVKSEVGKGTEFIITVPIDGPDEKESRKRA